MRLPCWIIVASFSIESTTAFAPTKTPSFLNNRVQQIQQQQQTVALNGWWQNIRGKNKEAPRASSGGDETTDVYASRVSNNNNNDGFIDTTLAVEETPGPSFDEETDFDVVVVGAGCSGIGTAVMLTRTFGLDINRVLVVDQGKEIGTSFRNWPEEMKFISPSFNQQGWTYSFDLNSIHYDTSPANMLRAEHPSGMEYAIYLESMAAYSNLLVQLETKVTSIEDVGVNKPKNENNGRRINGPGPFNIKLEQYKDDGTYSKSISSRFIVWAAGEFQFPNDKSVLEKAKKENPDETTPEGLFPGIEHCIHNSHVESWKKLDGDDFVVIGGYESGVDAAVNLAKAGKACNVLASTPCWDLATGDPSTELAPYTAARLREVQSAAFTAGPRPQLHAPLRVVSVDKAHDGDGYNVAAKWKELDEEEEAKMNKKSAGIRVSEQGTKDSLKVFHTKNPPVLCTGFEGSVKAQASHLFDFPNAEQELKGCIGNGPLLTKDDESTKVPGVFLVGPSVTHGELSFCFVYKFRQRFGVVANAICRELGMDTTNAVMQCRRENMYLDDFATCADTCGDAC